MSTRGRFPFRDLSAQNWLNLLLAAILALYLFYIVLELVLGRLCGQIGVDYCDYWSAGRVANVHGYRAVYDLELLDAAQESILPADADPNRIAVVPFPYFPIFIPPFQLMALLPPTTGFVIWSLLNLAGFVLYMAFFMRRLGVRERRTRLQLLMLASLPFFLNIYSGQVSVLLAICIGEFMRRRLDGHSLRAGLWLGGLALKPQLLILLAPLLLLHRSFRSVAGMAVSVIVIGLGSIALVGTAGLLQLFNLWRVYAEGGASNWIEGMLNFRMLGLQLTAALPGWLAWSLAILGTVAVLVLSLWSWRRPLGNRPVELATGMLGILAATISIAWHSHIHMAMVLIPPILLLAAAGTLAGPRLHYWVFLPSIMFLLTVFLPPALAQTKLISNPGAAYIYFFFAAAQLAVDLLLFAWALGASRRSA